MKPTEKKRVVNYRHWSQYKDKQEKQNYYKLVQPATDFPHPRLLRTKEYQVHSKLLQRWKVAVCAESIAKNHIGFSLFFHIFPFFAAICNNFLSILKQLSSVTFVFDGDYFVSVSVRVRVFDKLFTWNCVILNCGNVNRNSIVATKKECKMRIKA